MDNLTSRVESHIQRLRFEMLAGYGLALTVLSAGPIGMLSDKLAARVTELAPAVATLAGVLAATMGASWFRGAHDERINGGSNV